MEWISLNERLPEFGIDVLIWDSNRDEPFKGRLEEYRRSKYGMHWILSNCHAYNLSDSIKHKAHWQPLPEPPE